MIPSVTKSSLLFLLALATVWTAEPVRAQRLARQVERAPDGWVVFRYAIDADVEFCGRGVMRMSRSWRMSRRGGNEGSTSGLVEARLRVRNGTVTGIEVRPPAINRSDADPGSDLGEPNAREAAAYFLELARESTRTSVARDAIMPATIAEGVTVWPELRVLAGTQRLDEEVRHAAVFWLSQEDEEAALDALESIFEESDDVDMQEKVIFAISQHSSLRSIDFLFARAENPAESRAVRKQALFWLGQSDDPRAADLLLELIRGRVLR